MASGATSKPRVQSVLQNCKSAGAVLTRSGVKMAAKASRMAGSIATALRPPPLQVFV